MTVCLKCQPMCVVLTWDSSIRWVPHRKAYRNTYHTRYPMQHGKRDQRVTLQFRTQTTEGRSQRQRSESVDFKSVFKILPHKTGVPTTRIVAMIWMLTWEEAPEGTQAKPRPHARAAARLKPQICDGNK